MKRIERDKKTIEEMISIYCRRHHLQNSPSALCDDCRELCNYAFKRIDACPKGTKKRSCRKCDIHCYSSDKKLEIRKVMRYAGPRMIFINPIAAIRHLIHEFS